MGHLFAVLFEVDPEMCISSGIALYHVALGCHALKSFAKQQGQINEVGRKSNFLHQQPLTYLWTEFRL